MSFKNMQKINPTKGASGFFVGTKQSGNVPLSCEECSMRFTVFKRKKQCAVCQLLFCSNCLVTQVQQNGSPSVLSRFTDRKQLCRKCIILTARPLCRNQLLQLKVKDLQHYLTSQRISTRGCVEKDDLVNLLIHHVASTNNGSRPQATSAPFASQSQTDTSSGQQSSAWQWGSNPILDSNQPSTLLDYISRRIANSQSSGSGQQASANASPLPTHNQGDGPSVPTNTNIENQSNENETRPMDTRNPTVNSAVPMDTECQSENNPRPTVTSPMDNRSQSDIRRRPSDFEIIELSDWDADEVSEHGPVPVVEEISERVSGADSVSNSSIEELEDSNTTASTHITLKDIGSIEELEKLSIKQIKTLLCLNRVDFRGCCEKAELMDRARRLWQEYALTRKEVEKMTLGELCKICMDAPIECVMLECGHMATCMGCGKVLSECPICRQYVVRVVRTFRA